jgi:hypothetical protein
MPAAEPSRVVSLAPEREPEAQSLRGFDFRTLPLHSPGRPLDAATRSLMERGFGHDFSSVRLHTGPDAARIASSLDAAAYTVGSDIVFNDGQHDPRTHGGRRLIAHELGHVVQQRGNAASASAGAESEADRASRRAAFGIPIRSALGAVPFGMVQCSPLSDAVKKDVGPTPTVEELLTRLGQGDVQAGQSDTDLDAEIDRLLNNRADDIWLAKRVWHGLRQGKPGAAPRPIEAYFFAGTTSRRALVIAGVHGTERQGIAVARMLIDLLRRQQPALTTIVVPSLFPDNAAAGSFGSREGSAAKPNRNFPHPGQDLAAARKAGSVDALGNKILPENLLLMELMEKFQPERIISIHGTWDPNKAGVFYDPRALTAAEETQAATVQPSKHVQHTESGQEAEARELRDAKRKRMLAAASDADKDLSLRAAREIDKATATVKDREDRVAGKGRKAHPSVAGNVGASGDLDFAFWGGEAPEGVSLGGYASARGMSIFTVEPPVNRDVDDYKKGNKQFGPQDKQMDKVSEADRKTELMAYAEAVRAILLGQ